MSEPLDIFLVEDDAVILLQLQMLLEDAGHTVVGTAMSAREAIPLIVESQPEVVFLDLQLNDGSSGIEVVRALREQAEMLIVFITANARKLSGDLDGAMAVISKPFNERMIERSLAFLEECAHRPPPSLDMPYGMLLSPSYAARYASMR